MTQKEHLSEAAQLYLGAVITAGVVAVLHSLYILQIHPVTYHWLLLAGLTLLSGSFTIQIPTIPARLSVSETFVFATVLLFGPAAATMIVVLDSLVISLWLTRRTRNVSRVLFNVAAPSVAIWIASHAFYGLANVSPLSTQTAPPAVLSLVLPLVALAIVYFILNSVLIAGAVAFEKHISAVTVWRHNFLWLSLNYFSGASVAALLIPYLQPTQSDFRAIGTVIGILLPLLLVSYLTFKTAMGRVDDANRHLSELNRLYLSTIETLAMAIDAKDQITHGHIRRVQIHAVTLARAMGVTEEAQIRAIEAAALLHDMGKLAVPEYILNKPGPLTSAEFDKMKLHASIGADILSAIDFPYPVVPIVRHHHENWDGTGYPDRLSAAAIPIGARILSVVDCFDALTSDRPYRPRLSDKDAIRILTERRGRMYDPIVVDTFIRLHEDGGLRLPAAPTALSLAAITGSPASMNPRVSDAPSRLEDISASGEEMLVLFELARGLNSSMNLFALCDVLITHLRRIVPVSLLVFYRYSVDTDELISAYASAEHTGLVPGLRIPLGQRLTGWVGAHRQTIRNSDPVLDLGESARTTPRFRSCLSTPVLAGESLVGVLSLYSTGLDAFSEDHQRVVEVVAKQVAPVIQQALLSEPMNPVALRDHLTGLPNVAELESLSRSHIGAPEKAISVIYIDTGRLTETSHTYARESNDYLNYVVTCVRRYIRSTDVLFRYGKDELVVVQFDTDKNDAAAIASRILQAVDLEPLSAALPRRIRISVEVSASPEDGRSVEALVAAARQRVHLGNIRTGSEPSQKPGSIH